MIGEGDVEGEQGQKYVGASYSFRTLRMVFTIPFTTLKSSFVARWANLVAKGSTRFKVIWLDRKRLHSSHDV